MRRTCAGALLAVVLFGAAALVAGAPEGGAPPSEVGALLQQGGFASAEIATLAAGQTIARADSADNGEIVTIGAVRVRAPRAQTTAYYGQMIAYVDGKVTLAFGKFSTPPALDDVKALALDADEIADLRACKPGKCDLRVGGAGIEAFRRSIDWKAPDADARVQTAFRQAAVTYVGAYMQRGDDALVTYADTAKGTSLAQEWRGILANSEQLRAYAPALRDYLAQYPKATLPGARDVLYWIKENYGLKPTITAVHAVIYDPPDRRDRTIVAQKQIYASHYYDASLAVAVLFDAVEDGRAVTYIVYANRSRGDAMKGGLGVRRKVARDQARTAAIQTLGTIQTALERAAGLQP